ncbi:MAG: carbon-nitrogen family hydrolase [Acidimicrobiales bacterium]|nr:carbon-nitrogen family hydrolase [Acidimicrobiales bacterium]
MRTAVVQHDIAWEDPGGTHALVAPMIAEAADRGARLIVLTEMYATGFSMATERIAEPVDGPATTFLAEQATRHDAWVAGSVATRITDDDSGLPPFVNRLHVFGPAGEHHHYDKIHPFSYAREHEHYRPGTGFVTVDIDGVRATLFVCYDLRFADEFWATALDTDMYIVPANWPAVRSHHWTSLLVARAIENQAYVVAANRVGEGGHVTKLEYAGDSIVLDPLGQPVAQSAGPEPQVLVGDIDPAVVADVRSTMPFLADRR